MGLLCYSLLLLATLVLSAPVWGWRMARQGRYREGLRERLGQVPERLRRAVQGQRVVWVHAVSVGELLAAGRLIHELGETLGAGWTVVVSTTTATGQKLARERFGADRVFFWPLDLGFAVRAYLRALQPELLVLLESELWPRMLSECRRAGVPVAVVNARMSDRSFRRARRFAALWRWMAKGVTVFFAQGDETAARLRMLGAADVRTMGNLKYDLSSRPRNQTLAGGLEHAVRNRTLVVAGSTLEGEERMLLDAWPTVLQHLPTAVLLLAPRHPQRFAEVETLLERSGTPLLVMSRHELLPAEVESGSVLLLDSLGHLADIYGIARVAFVGGSLVPKGGHNPLEAARFGVPVLMGPSYENFREMVEGMLQADAIFVVQPDRLAWGLRFLLEDTTGIGERGRLFYESQAGATGRTVAALRELLRA